MEAIMKNVLVLLHDDAGQEARLQCALDLARAIKGHLTCLDVSVLPMTVNDYAMFGGVALLVADEEVNERQNRMRVEPRLADEEVPYDWIDVTGELGDALEGAATLTDVIVVNRELDDIHYPNMLGIVGELLVRSGKPVLAVPETARSLDAFGRAMVAWDGSRAAEAALRAAVPLLRLARHVTILEVDDGSLKVSAFDAAEYLSRHGIKPTICRRAALTDIASTVILAELKIAKADYLVMGGFGHSRLKEAVLGGVTRRMLCNSPVPLFLAH
jgi:nucleotide-binding universal stress UspA family protein